MKIQAFTLLFFALLISVTGCKKKKNEFVCEDGSTNFTHLAQGHEFVYALYGSGGDTMTITIDTTTEAGTYKASVRTDTSASINTIYYHACKKDLYTSSTGVPLQYEHWWLSLDANAGDTWTRTLGNNIYNYKLLSKTLTLTTPFIGNTYTDCYQFTYNRNGSSIVDTIYFKPDTGIVFYSGSTGSYELARKNF